MYKPFFGLKEHPFKNTPTTQGFFPGAERAEILAALIHLLERNDAFIKLTGEVGTGKTTLLHNLINRLITDPRYQLVFFPSPQLTPEAMLKHLCAELGITPSAHADKADLYQLIYRHVIEQFSQNKEVIILVDEAHLMPLETLEELRLLSNIETQERKLIQIVLAGQPELDTLLATPQARALASRINHSLKLKAPTDTEIQAYLNHRMTKAGYRGTPVFSQKVARKINKRACGSLRTANNLADKALMSAYLHKRPQVLPQDIDTASPKRAKSYLLLLLLGIGTAIASLLFLETFSNDNSEFTATINKKNNILFVAKNPGHCTTKAEQNLIGQLVYQQAGQQKCLKIFRALNQHNIKYYAELTLQDIEKLAKQRNGRLHWLASP